MRRVLSARFDCEKFIAHFEGFIAQSGDLSLKHVSSPSQLIETNNEHNPLPQKAL
jgi:hypothetical protein